ncbi:hypothetical protein [Paenibacillus xylanexedens]|uniref:hypothetical protein n=1 Tax=Paenibacillus xylanexedens TaxID=528191 RepID=UPI0011A90371|nr:hypothetical protein [Paenibacillus xylanexedens]
MVNLKSIIDEELKMRFSEARAAGNEYLDVTSGDIHKELGFKHRMPSYERNDEDGRCDLVRTTQG